MSKKTDNAVDWSQFMRIAKLSLPYKNKMALAIFLTLGIAILGPLRPYLVQYTLDNAINQLNQKELMLMSALIFLLLILQTVFQYFSTLLGNILAQNILFDLRKSVYKHLNSFQLQFFNKTPVGTLVTRSISDIETISDIFSEGLINIIGEALQIAFMLFLMFYTNWKLSLVCLSVLPLLFYASYVFKEKVKASFEEVRNEVARLNTFVQEHLSGMQIVQLFNRQNSEFEKFKNINQQHAKANIKSVLYYSVFFPVVEVISAISTGLLIWFGAKEVLMEQTSIGTLVAFIMYISMFFRPIRQLADRFNSLQMGMVSSKRIFALLDNTSEQETGGTTTTFKLEGNIQFKEVWFAYNENKPTLKGIHFEVKKGQSIAIVGATGAGKSTIFQLLSKYFSIQKGSIFIDGRPIESFQAQALRQQLSVVQQDVFLFSGSIFDNIRLYRENISDETIIAMSKKLGAHEFISKLPNQYHEKVNERGSSLSVGQRQLISFVRAMVSDPQILLLDEATASIDHDTEHIIQHAISTMMQGRTSLVIAHRLSTIQHADEILVLEQGQIIERGTHQNLLLQKGIYENLYVNQFQDLT
jgi:ATP-binding cassette subfamily B protein